MYVFRYFKFKTKLTLFDSSPVYFRFLSRLKGKRYKKKISLYKKFEKRELDREYFPAETYPSFRFKQDNTFFKLH